MKNETVVRLAAHVAVGGDAEALAAVASRISRIVGGIAALRMLLA